MWYDTEAEGDGRFECALAHIHDIYGYPGELTHEGAPCPNDPEAPNAYPEDECSACGDPFSNPNCCGA